MSAHPTTRPSTQPPAPDASDSYERSHPEHESGMGRLDNNKAGPVESPDVMEKTVGHRQDGSRQINAHETENHRRTIKPAGEK